MNCCKQENKRNDTELLSNFVKVTQSPETLAKFLKDVLNGTLQLDMLFCNKDCEECNGELDCITQWLKNT